MGSERKTGKKKLVTLTLLGGMFLLSGCGTLSERDSGPRQAMDFSDLPNAVPKSEQRTRAGNPKSYVVLGKRYNVLTSSAGYNERGIASWYGNKFHGHKTSNGEIYNMYAMTAAHKTLPIPCYVQVTNLDNGKSVVVRVNDRGPFHENRIIDLSYAAASKLGIAQNGTGKVELRAIEPGQTAPPTTTQVATREEAAPATNVVSTAAPRNQLYLQLGSFIERERAESMKAQLMLNNLTATTIQQTEIDRRNIYRVRIGPLATVEEADRIAEQIDQLGMGVPAIVID